MVDYIENFNIAWNTLKGNLGGGLFQCDTCGETLFGLTRYQQHIKQTGHMSRDTGGTFYT